ncbi:MAG: hypothetical protein ABI193_10470 [Minicystis sp.]
MSRARSRPTVGEVSRLALLVLFFTAAPTAGDIGSCNQAENDLDPAKFFATKQSVDCQRCQDCQISTKICERSCDPGLIIRDFEPGCVPLEHDGEVCVDALAAATCGDYQSFMSDSAATAPTECQFCPIRADAGASE